ncbi:MULTISPECIES: hypothetical protein [Acetobacteraceae]|uniref:hypothetical protein n=1 Tax=Acetobacteraceae TaxID=433 RepID=UPI0039ECFB79
MTDAQYRRDAILSALLETSNFGETPAPGILYLPRSHLKALRLDAQVIVGGRGVGKSFWTAALQSPPLRTLLGSAASELNGINVYPGFTNLEDINRYPNADVFSSFLDKKGDPYDLWRAVILRCIAQQQGEKIPDKDWPSTVHWLKDDPEAAAKLMQRPRNGKGLILFDALDRTSSDWRRMDEIVRGLLRAVLWLKSFPNLYAKVFLREDQAERTVFNFPDASKLMANKAELTWARHDLHGLLWQRLVNAPGAYGKCLRGICPNVKQNSVWGVASEMKSESEVQRRAFEALAGPWMGRDKRRGVPYTWSVGHLADGRGQTSPRSFLAAIRQAAEDSNERYPTFEYALHFESIKRGIQKASEIRVQEIAEDYPWVPNILSALKGTNVPAEYQAVRILWEQRFPVGPSAVMSVNNLPAQHIDRGWDGLRDDLQRLGLIEMKKDGRLDMPDLYRVGFGLGRKGGVKPRK